MPITIGSNIASLGAQRQLGKTTESLGNTYERLSSGMRINKASDDAAVLAIASSLKTDTRVFTQAIRNISDGVSTLNIAEGALTQLTNIGQRQMELAEQAANGTYSYQQRKAMNTEANALVDEWNRITQTTKFNGVQLLDGTQFTDSSNGGLKIQAGNDSSANSQLAIGIGDKLSRIVGTGATTVLGTTVSSPSVGYIGSSDVNNDGNIDLVSFDFTDHVINTSLGNGDGTFKAYISSVAGAGVNQGQDRDVIARDLNGDGKLDIITVDQDATGSANKLLVLLGNGNGTFLAQRSYTIGSIVSTHLTVADYNGDGKDDIAVGSASDNVTVFFGNSDGSFGGASVIGIYGSSHGVSSGDFNGDGKVDIISSGNTGAQLLINNGNGTFKVTALSNTFIGAGRGTAAIDINGDGNLDYAFADTGATSYMQIGFGNGDGTFKAATSYQTGSRLDYISVADFNKDGFDDLSLSSAFNGSSAIFLANSDGSLKVGSIGVANSYMGSVGDYNNDGVSDVAYGGAGSISIGLSNTTKATSVSKLNLLSQSSARTSLGIISSALDHVTSELGALGSMQSRFQVASNTLRVSTENYAAATSRILDVDVAQESADLTRKQILQQAAASVLGQANKQPQLALQLLRG